MSNLFITPCHDGYVVKVMSIEKKTLSAEKGIDRDGFEDWNVLCYWWEYVFIQETLISLTFLTYAVYKKMIGYIQNIGSDRIDLL